MQIRVIAFLFLVQLLASCRQDPVHKRLVEAGIDSPEVAAASSDTETLAAEVYNVVYKSLDGGQTWQDITSGLPTGVEVEGVYTCGGEVILGSRDGIYRLRPGARGWEQEQFLDGRITRVVNGQRGLYACSYGLGLFRNVAGSDIWNPISRNLPDMMVRTVLETPDGSVLIGADSGIYKSGDGGQSWKHVFDDGIVLDIVQSGNVLLSGGRHGVTRSTDGGENWEYVLNENILAKKTVFTGNNFVAILGTRDAMHVDPAGITSRIRTSFDGGKSWQRIERSRLSVNETYPMDERLSQVKDVFDIIQVGEYLLCSFDSGIYRSSDRGKTWEPVLPTKKRSGFTFAKSGSIVYAVDGGGGC